MKPLISLLLAKAGLSLATAVLFLALACGEYDSEEANYSGAFGHWLYRSVQLSQEIERARTYADVPDFEPVFRDQLQTMASRQLEFNDHLRGVVPPKSLSKKHGLIVGVLDLYQDPLAGFTRVSSSPEPLPSLISRFEAEQAKLMDAVITCYAESPAC